MALKGKKQSREHIKKRILARIWYKPSKETREKMSKAKKGKPLSEEHKKHLSESHKGSKNVMFGRKHSKKTKEKIRKKIIGKFVGSKNHQWKGENASYYCKHTWVIKWKGAPRYCEHCGRTDKRKYEWANINHKFRRNLDDYIRLCTSCHRKYDYKNHLCNKGSRWGSINNKQ